MDRTENVSHSPDNFDRPQIAAGILAAVILVVAYLATVTAMRAVLALGWYVA